MSRSHSSEDDVAGLTSQLNETTISNGSSDSTSGMDRRSDRPSSSSSGGSGGRPSNYARGPGYVPGQGINYGRAGPRPGSSMSSTSSKRDANIPRTERPWYNLPLAQRPGECMAGTPVRVFANYFGVRMPQLAPNQKYVVQQYNVEIAKYDERARQFKDVKKREHTRQIFWQCVAQHMYICNSPAELVFNDVNILYCKNILRESPNPNYTNRGMFSLDVNIGERNKSTRYQVSFKFADEKSVDPNGELQEERDLAITFFDCLFTQRVRCDLHDDSQLFTTFGHSVFYFPQNGAPEESRFKIDIGNGMDVRIGVHGAIKNNTTGGLYYNVNTSFSAYHKTMVEMFKFMAEVLGEQCPLNQRNMPAGQIGLDNWMRGRLEGAVKGLSVVYKDMSRHGQFTNPVEVIRVDNKPAFRHEFELRDESGRTQRVSVVNYYQNKYGYSVQYPQLPCLILGKPKSKKQCAVPLELCRLAAVPQKIKGQLDPVPKRTMIQACEKMNPKERRELIGMMIDGDEGSMTGCNLHAQDEYMREFGIVLDPQMVTVNGKLLPRPNLQFGSRDDSGQPEVVEPNNEAGWQITLPNQNTWRQCIEPPKKKMVACVLRVVTAGRNQKTIRPPVTDEECYRRGQFLMATLEAFGVPIVQARPVMVDEWLSCADNAAFTLYNNLKGWREDMENEAKSAGFEIICMPIFVFPNQDKTAYMHIKYVCDVKLGMHNQCILHKTFEKMIGNPLNNSTAHNMFMKMNAKAGGLLYRLEKEGSHKNWNKVTNPQEPTLFLGIDVTHPGAADRAKNNDEGQSVASVVGNIDFDAMRYEASYRVQEGGRDVERIVSLKTEVMSRITRFFEETNMYPAHIVVYRDGISETDFRRFLYEEKRGVEAACESVRPGYKPTITYIVVQKRHHTRFFPMDAGCGPKGNVAPGLLVEQDIVSKAGFDFFICSHFGPLGTSRPTHYWVLADDWNESPSFWQTVTFALCFAYVRTPRSVSLPAPVYYAHLAAKQSKLYLDSYQQCEEQRVATAAEMFINRNNAIQPEQMKGRGMIFC